MSNKMQSAIFDMDGTLLDSMYIWIGVGPRYLGYKGITTSPEGEKELAGKALVKMGEIFREKYGFTMSIQEIVDDINRFVEDEYFHKVQPKPGVIDMLENFKSRGIKMCVATASDRYLVEAALKRTDLLKYFDKVYTCPDENTTKEKPDIFINAAKFMDTRIEDTYVFEDTYYSIKTAKDAGFPVVAIYDIWSEKTIDKIKAISDIFVNNFTELDYKSL